MNITIYTKSNCPNCTTAKQLMYAKGLKYDEWDVEFSPQNLQKLLADYPDVKQMPFILIDGQRVGGLAGLQAALKELGL